MILKADGSPIEPTKSNDPIVQAFTHSQWEKVSGMIRERSLFMLALATMARLKGGKISVSIKNMIATEDEGLSLTYINNATIGTFDFVIDAPTLDSVAFDQEIIKETVN